MNIFQNVRRARGRTGFCQAFSPLQRHLCLGHFRSGNQGRDGFKKLLATPIAIEHKARRTRPAFEGLGILELMIVSGEGEWD